MKNKGMRFLMLVLSCALLLTAMPVSAAAASTTGFPDVPAGIWYEDELEKIMWAQQMVGQTNIISGLYNDEGVLVFEPEREVTRGEFLKMLFEAAESSGNQVSFETNEAQSKAHWAGKYYTKAQADNVLVADVYSNTQAMFPCTEAALDQPISRYEMAVILNNVCTNVAMQKTVIVSEPESHITDYSAIGANYIAAVEQAYGKGLLTGHEDGSFAGGDTLKRCEALVVIYRYLFQDTIQGEGLQDWAEYPKAATSNYLDPSLSFANWLRNGHVDAWGNLDAEAKTKLFGSPYKSYFTSASDAAAYMTTVSVPIWTMDKAGNKISSTCPITVHVLVAEEVKSIFQMIYDDPEQFPIYGGWSAGGARYTDTLRHSWGCAIDINAYYNCECTINWNTYKNNVTCGYGWWPIGHADATFKGSMTGQSPYSIGKNENEYGYSVVKAFTTYGWGWAGKGYSLKSNGNQKFDFMHFSVLPSGG